MNRLKMPDMFLLKFSILFVIVCRTCLFVVIRVFFLKGGEEIVALLQRTLITFPCLLHFVQLINNQNFLISNLNHSFYLLQLCLSKHTTLGIYLVRYSNINQNSGFY